MSDGPNGGAARSTCRVVVIGGGVAGTAAALGAARAGSRVTLVAGGTGATVLSSGALDFVPWQSEGARAEDRDLDGDARAILDALGGYLVTSSSMILATTAGILRPARGADRAALDLAKLGPGALLVPRSDHHGWDAVTLARSWSDSRLARAHGWTFVAIDAQITRYRDERPLRDPEIAARHDDPARLAWLADRLREALARGGPFAGVVLPPWLGVDAPRAEALSERVGVPCGEAVTGLASAAGIRFEHARERALGAAGVEILGAWATSAAPAGAGWSITVDGEAIAGDAAVLAAGGVLGGGLVYEPSASMFGTAVPAYARPTFRAVIDAPGVVGVRGKPLDLAGSLFGAPPEALAWPFTNEPLLERAGLLVGSDLRVLGAPPGLFACGELVADLPRAWLAAFVSGVRAGAAAAASASASASAAVPASSATPASASDAPASARPEGAAGDVSRDDRA